MGTYRHPGTVITGHFRPVPLDHCRLEGEEISVFAREVVAAGDEGKSLPWLVFPQGGPGHPAQRMTGRRSWLDRAPRDYRVLLPDGLRPWVTSEWQHDGLGVSDGAVLGRLLAMNRGES